MNINNIKTLDLTEKQLHVISDNTYPGYLISCAGTGKTEIISHKIANLIINHKVPLNKIALITFTNKASNEMRNRINAILYKKYIETDDSFLRAQIDYLGFAKIDTIHAFCQSLLRSYGFSINISPTFNVSSFIFEIKNIIFTELKKHYAAHNVSLIPSFRIVELIKDLYTSNTIQGINVRESDFIIEDSESELRELKFTLKKIYLNIVDEIEKEKFEKNILTPNDLIKYAVKLLENKQTAQLVSEQYKYVFIDEFQDTNQDQFNLLELMIKNGINIFIAGDENQSIYGWRGANVENFNNMISKINVNKTSRLLNENFRTDNNLLQQINYIFKSKFHYNNQLLKFNHIELQNINTKGCIKPLKLLSQVTIVDCVSKLLAEEKEFKDIAVLCRTNNEVNVYASALKQKGFPVTIYGGRSFYKTSLVIEACKVLNALIYGGSINKHEIQYTEFYMAFKKFGKNNPNELIDDLRSEIKKYSVSNFLNILYNTTFIIQYLEELNRQQDIANLYKLIDISRAYGESSSLTIDFVEYLNIMISTEKEEDQAEIPLNRTNNSITVSTIHKVKGLSFNNVILPNIDRNLATAKQPKIVFEQESEFGLDCEALYGKQSKSFSDVSYNRFMTKKNIRNLEEELRVFFVALTRAKEQICLLCEKPIGRTIYKMGKNKQYVSYFRWLYEIDNGRFVNNYLTGW